MFKSNPDDTKPCPHMRLLVSALSDGALTGIARWYTIKHLDGCGQCCKGLAAILEVRARLRDAHEESEEETQLSPEQWHAVEEAWLRAEQDHSKPIP